MDVSGSQKHTHARTHTNAPTQRERDGKSGVGLGEGARGPNCEVVVVGFVSRMVD